MGFNDKHTNAGGRDPDYGAIFISNTVTKRECFKRGFFGLPSSYIPFVEKIKAGTVLFLFEYEKKLLHGVFKATCDGGINIVPDAFTSSGNQYPAQVKFITVWSCEPLPEKIFRDAIRENYYSSNKFEFGLSEEQVYKLLHLFSMNKLEPEVPRRHMSRTEDMKSDRYPVGKVGRSVGHGMLDESGQDGLVLGVNNYSPISMHNYQGDSTRYNGGFCADDVLVNKQRMSSELGVDYTSGYISDYLPSKDEIRFAARDNEDCIDNYASKLTVDTARGYVNDYLAIKDQRRLTSHENKDYMGTHISPYTVGGYSKIPSDQISVHAESADRRSSIRDRLMGEDLRRTDQRMVFSDDIPSLYDSNVDHPGFYSKPTLEQNPLKSSSAMIHPFQGQTLNTSCATLGDKRSFLYNADAPGLKFRPLSSVGINNGSESITERLSPSTNCLRNSVSRGPRLMHSELEDNHRWHGIDSGYSNSVLYGSNRDCMPFNDARNSDQLASESALYKGRQSDQLVSESAIYEAHNNIPAVKSSPAPMLSSDIGAFPSLFHDRESYLGNDVHPMALQKYLSHEITLQKNNERSSLEVPLTNEGHYQVQYDDSLDHGYDIGCYGDSQNSNHGHQKRNSSVFSRLSFVKNGYKQENGNNSHNEEYDFHTSVNEVMEMVRQSHSHKMTKRKPNPSQRIKGESLRNKTSISSHRKKSESFENALEHNKDESLRKKTHISSPKKKKGCSEKALQHNKDEVLRNKTQISSPKRKREDNRDGSLRNKTKISSPRKKRDCLEDLNMDSKTVTGGDPNTTAKEIGFVDFKRRSKVRKHSDDIERSSNDNKYSENLVPVQQKRKKLIRPNFNNSTSFDDKDIDLGASRNLQLPLPNGSHNLKDVIESCCTLVNQSGNGVQTDAEVQNTIDPTHSEGKNSSNAMGFITSEDEEKTNDGTLPASYDGSECADNKNHQKVLSSDSCKEESSHTKKSSSMMDAIKSASLEMESLHAVCQENNEDKIIYADVGISADGEMPKDCGSISSEAKDGTEYNSDRGINAEDLMPKESSHTKIGSSMMDNIKPASLETESLQAICQENNTDKIICADGGISADGQIPKNCVSSIEVRDGTESNADKTICADRGFNVETIMPKESSHTKLGSSMMDNIKSASLETESLQAICQENNADKIICTDIGISADGKMPKDCGSFSIEVKDGSEYLGNSGNEKASIETSCHIEACM